MRTLFNNFKNTYNRLPYTFCSDKVNKKNVVFGARKNASKDVFSATMKKPSTKSNPLWSIFRVWIKLQ